MAQLMGHFLTHAFILTSDPLHLVSLQVLYLWVGKCVNELFIRDVLGCPNYASIPPNMVSTLNFDLPINPS